MRRGSKELLAAALVLDFGRSVHTQYLAVSARGRQLDALSLLLAELITQVYAQRHYFSFGISTEQAGQVLNDGLVEQRNVSAHAPWYRIFIGGCCNGCAVLGFARGQCAVCG